MTRDQTIESEKQKVGRDGWVLSRVEQRSPPPPGPESEQGKEEFGGDWMLTGG